MKNRRPDDINQYSSLLSKAKSVKVEVDQCSYSSSVGDDIACIANKIILGDDQTLTIGINHNEVTDIFEVLNALKKGLNANIIVRINTVSLNRDFINKYWYDKKDLKPFKFNYGKLMFESKCYSLTTPNKVYEDDDKWVHEFEL